MFVMASTSAANVLEKPLHAVEPGSLALMFEVTFLIGANAI